ncbi:MAG: toxin protein VapC [Pseudomonadota bacterium]|jgi:predicted nucleic acid-binding protein
MVWLLDTSVVIHVLEGQPDIAAAVGQLAPAPAISALTRAELENGVARDPAEAALRRALLDAFLTAVDVLPFDDAAAAEYGRIVGTLGYSRAKTIDRMLAAQAIVTDAQLVTMNGDDFRNIPGLNVSVWSL